MKKHLLIIIHLLSIVWGQNTWTNYQFGKSGVPYSYRYSHGIDSIHVFAKLPASIVSFDGNYFTHNPLGSNINPVEKINTRIDVENDSIYWLECIDDIFEYAKINISTLQAELYGIDEVSVGYDNLYGLEISPWGDKWFQTSDSGVIRFDDDKWYRYDTVNTPMPMNYHNFICFDSSGNTYLSAGNMSGSKGGVTIFDGESWEHFDYNNSPIPRALVVDITVDKNNTLWIASDSGLNSLKDGVWNTWTVSDLPIDNPQYKGFHNLVIAPDSAIWVESNSIHARLKDGVWNIIEKDIDNYPDSSWSDKPVFDSTGNVWFGTEKRGIIKYDYNSISIYDSTNSTIPTIKSQPVRVLPNGEVWSGFSKYDPQSDTWSKPLTPYNTGIANDTVHAITTLKDGRPFIVTNYGVSVRDSLQRWTVYEKDHLENFPINDIDYLITSGDTTYAFRSGYVAPNYGAIFVKGEWKSFQVTLPSGGTINDVTRSDDGTLWFATSKGVSTYKDNQWTEVSSEGLPSIDLTTITSIKNKPVVGNSYGVYHFHEGQWQKYSKINELVSSDYTVDLESDSLGRLWVATLRDGILSYDGSDWILYDTTNSELPQDVVTKISADKMGNVWVATQDSGVAVYKNGQFKAYNTENSKLQSNIVTTIAFDNKNHKWFGTDTMGVANLIDEDSLIVSIIDDNFLNDSKAKLSCQLSNNALTIKGLNSNALASLYNIKGQRLLQVKLSQKQNKIPLNSHLTQSILFLEVLQDSKRHIFKLIR